MEPTVYIFTNNQFTEKIRDGIKNKHKYAIIDKNKIRQTYNGNLDKLFKKLNYNISYANIRTSQRKGKIHIASNGQYESTYDSKENLIRTLWYLTKTISIDDEFFDNFNEIIYDIINNDISDENNIFTIHVIGEGVDGMTEITTINITYFENNCSIRMPYTDYKYTYYKHANCDIKFHRFTLD